MAKSWVKRKIITWTAVLLVVMMAIFFVMPISGFAKDEDAEEASTITASGLFDMLDNIFGTSDYGTYSSYKYSSNGYLRDVANSINSGRLSEIYNDTIVSDIEDAVKIFGYLLVIVIVAVMCFQEASRGEMNEESWLRLFVVYLVGTVMVSYSATIFNAIYYLGMYVIQQISTVSIDAYEQTGNVFDGMAWWIRIVGRLCMWACKFSIVIPAWQIFYELVIRRMFAPIAVADCVAEGTHSPGFRYMKNFFGMFLRIAICYIIVGLMGTFLGTLDAAEGDGWFFQFLSMIGIIFGGSGLMMKTQSLVREIVGG